METQLKKATWLCGASLTLADVAAYPLARRIPDLLPETANDTATPGLVAWLSRMSALEAVKRGLSHAQADAGAAIDYAPPR